MIKIAIAEDNSFALSALIEKIQPYTEEVTVRFSAYNGQELIQKLKENPHVDAILMDLQMPQINGIEATAWVKKELPHIKVIMLTVMDDDEMVFDAFMAGANGYLLKEESGHNIVQALRDTQVGGAGMSPSIAYKVLKMTKQGSATLFGKKTDYNITKRELEILTQLKTGLSYDKIGQNLFISTGTVRKHLENIYKKLQAHNKIEAVNIASKHGLI